MRCRESGVQVKSLDAVLLTTIKSVNCKTRFLMCVSDTD